MRAWSRTVVGRRRQAPPPASTGRALNDLRTRCVTKFNETSMNERTVGLFLLPALLLHAFTVVMHAIANDEECCENKPGDEYNNEPGAAACVRVEQRIHHLPSASLGPDGDVAALVSTAKAKDVRWSQSQKSYARIT